MALVINNNLMAMTVARNFSTAYNQLTVSTNRLSSGLRINSAADDAAGLAVSELMRADIAALRQGARNAADAQSLIQTADGALSIIDEKLIRMKELSEQAATGTYTSTQRTIMNNEFVTMRSEITRIAEATRFNGVQLINGSLSATTVTSSGRNSVNPLKIHFGPTNSITEDYYFITIGSATAEALGLTGTGTDAAAAAAAETAYVSENNLIFDQNDYHLNEGGIWYELLPDNLKPDFLGQSGTIYDDPDTNDFYHLIITDQDGNLFDLTYLDEGGGGTREFRGAIQITSDDITINTQTAAQQALSAITEAIVSKDTIRANLGAYSNRLSNTISQLNIQAENLQAAESRIRDVDVAMEMTNFITNQIKSQAAIAMLSQANMIPNMALSLIGA